MADTDFLTGYDAPTTSPPAGSQQPAAPSAPHDSSLDFLTQDFSGDSNATAPSGNLGFSTIPGSLLQGIRHGIGDVGQTFGSSASGPESPAAAPFGWGDITNPGGALSKFAYRVGEGSPTIAGGVAGGAAGTALTGGPWGGIGGGALGAAAGSALQTLGPAFKRELAATPDDPDGAWSRALGSAMRSGAFSGAAWAAFPMRFFEGPVKNAAFQILGIQPGLAMAHQATENVAHGEPIGQGLPEAYTEGAVGTALPMVGARVVRGVSGLTGSNAEAAAKEAAAKAAKGEPPTAGELEDIGRQHYQDIEKWGVYYTNPKELAQTRDKIHDMLYRSGADPRMQARVFNAVNALTESRRPNGTVDWVDVDHVRRMLSDSLSDADASTRRAAAIAIHGKSGLDAWIEDPQAQVRAGVDPDLAPALSEKAQAARAYWQAAKGMEAWDRLIEKANNASNAREVTFRNEVRKIVNNPRLHWQYPPEAIDLMREGLHRGFWQAAAHASKLFDPHSSFGLFTNFMSHSMFGPEGLLAMPLAMGARYIGQRPLARVEEQVPRMIAARPSGGMPAPSTTASRTGENYSPYMGPVVPQQQQARGGAVRRALRVARADGGDVDQPDAPIEMPDPVTQQVTPTGGDPFSQHMGTVRQIGADLAPAWSSPFYGMSPEQSESEAKTLANPPAVNPGKIGPGYASDTDRATAAALDVGSQLAPELKAAAAMKGMFFAPSRAVASNVADLERAGSTPQQIWQATNAFRDAMGNLREEVLGPTKLKIDPREVDPGMSVSTTMGKAIDAPHIFERSPELSDTALDIYHAPQSPKLRGEYTPYVRFPDEGGKPGDIGIQPFIWTNPTNTDPLSNLIHEGQHAIDQRAGYLHGPAGNPDWQNRVVEDPNDPIYHHFLDLRKEGHDEYTARQMANYQRYYREVDEVMARLAAKREDMFNFLHDMDPRQARQLAKSSPFEYGSQMAEDVPRQLQMWGRTIPKKHGGAVNKALRIARADGGATDQLSGIGPVTAQEVAAIDPTFEHRLYAYGAQPSQNVEDRTGHQNTWGEAIRIELANQMAGWQDLGEILGLRDRYHPLFSLPEPRYHPRQSGHLHEDAGYYDIGRH